MSIEHITILMFATFLILLVTGLPVVFCLSTTSIIFAYALWGPPALGLLSRTLFGQTFNFPLLAIPLFVFMAHILQHSGIGENLYETMYNWFGPINGGLAMGTVVACAIIAAMSGLSATGTLSMGIVAIPAMFKRKYNKSITLGSVAAGGALGALIPPSVPMIVYSFLSGVSVGKMFLGGVLPGLLLAFFYITYIGVRSFIQPQLGPALSTEERATWAEKVRSLRLVILPILLVLAVLGSIFAGIATPTEAAAVGSLGGILCAAVNRKLTLKSLKLATYDTLKITTMLMWIMGAGICFSAVYTGLGAPQLVQDTLGALEVGPWGVLVIMEVSLIILGMFLDPNSIMIITVPIYVPLIIELGFDPLWFGILFVMNIEIAYLTPPFGWNIFYLKSIVPANITITDIYRAVGAFVALQVTGLGIVMAFPQIALWLPALMIGR